VWREKRGAQRAIGVRGLTAPPPPRARRFCAVFSRPPPPPSLSLLPPTNPPTPLTPPQPTKHPPKNSTCLTTEECLLHPNRNPSLGKSEVEAALRRHLGVRKVIWLPLGLYADHDTNGHIDNFACFARPGVVLLAWTDDEKDPQHEISTRALEILRREKDARGRDLEIVKLPCPPVLERTQEEYEGLAPEGREHRAPGERLAASYVNFYVANGGVVAPAFGGAAEEADARAAEVLRRAFPGREVVQVPTREIVLGGGNIHCITQQQPTSAVDRSIVEEEEEEEKKGGFGLFLPFAEE
jgi:agmatine/peptidylarginine deiminase